MKKDILERIDLGAVRPSGWLNDFLNAQAEGLTGHLDKIGYPYNIEFWKGKTKDGQTPPWEVFEQTAYWLDGMYCCGVLTGRKDLVERADGCFDYALSHIAEDGFIGPDVLRAESGWHRWPHVVFFRGLIAKYEYTKDERIPKAISDFYLKGNYDYSTKREFLNTEIMLWAYGRTGDPRLLTLAENTYAEYNAKCLDDNCEDIMLSDKKPYAHGVTYDETCKIGAVLYLYTGKRKYLNVAEHAFVKLERMFLLPDGGHCSNEFMIGNDTLQSHETCTITDYTWALSYLLMATKNAKYADKIEKCIFNAGIGAVNEDFTAIQYFSCPNQVIAAENSNHNEFFRGTGWMRFNARHHTACCSGNCNRFMPNFCRHLWFRNGKNLYAAMYAPSRITYEDGLTIEQLSDYPFEDEVVFRFCTEKPVRMAFHMRIPGWIKGAEVEMNGKPCSFAEQGGFACVERDFADGDLLVLKLYPQIEIRENADRGVYIERGPLVYSLGIRIKKSVTHSDCPDCSLPDYEYFPDSDWNFAVNKRELTEENLVFCRDGVKGNPWSAETPVSIEIPAHKVPGWTMEQESEVVQGYDLYARKTREVQGDFLFTPHLPDGDVLSRAEKAEKIKLVPQGAAKLRITVFPQLES